MQDLLNKNQFIVAMYGMYILMNTLQIKDQKKSAKTNKRHVG